MVEYFREAEPADAAWAVYFLSGGRPKRLIPVAAPRGVGDGGGGRPRLAVRRVLRRRRRSRRDDRRCCCPTATSTADVPLHRWIEERLLPLANRREEEQRASDRCRAWRELGGDGAVRLEQADHRRLSRRRVAAARRARAVARDAASTKA